MLYLTTDRWHILPGDKDKAGQAIQGNTLSNVVITAGLYAGTSSSQLYLYSTTLLNSTLPALAGYYGPMNIKLNSYVNADGQTTPAIPDHTHGVIDSTSPWFQIRFWDSRYASYDLAVAAFDPSQLRNPLKNPYHGVSQIFQANPGSLSNYRAIIVNGGVDTTWVDSPLFVEAFIPEPSTVALAGLGAAGLLIYRRRR